MLFGSVSKLVTHVTGLNPHVGKHGDKRSSKSSRGWNFIENLLKWWTNHQSDFQLFFCQSTDWSTNRWKFWSLYRSLRELRCVNSTFIFFWSDYDHNIYSMKNIKHHNTSLFSETNICHLQTKEENSLTLLMNDLQFITFFLNEVM